MSGFSVGLELRKWAIADGLGFIPEDHPETCHHNFDLLRRGCFLEVCTGPGLVRGPYPAQPAGRAGPADERLFFQRAGQANEG